MARAVELNPARAEAHDDLGLAHLGLVDVPSAAAAYAEALQKDRQHDRSRRALARLSGGSTTPGARTAPSGDAHDAAEDR